MIQSGFFDTEDRYAKLNELDPLPKLNDSINWSVFRPILAKTVKANKVVGGRPPYDVIMMFKILVLQHLYNISDGQLEFQIRDRMTFCRFLGLTASGNVPDANTIWAFREKLVRLDLMKKLFDKFGAELNKAGFEAKKGQIVDASFVNVPKQRNSKDENDEIKGGGRPSSFDESPSKGAQKDTDARWAKKNKETHYGYKDHVVVDVKNKLIRNYDVTSAEVHDSNVFTELLTDNTSKDVWADSAYRSEDIEDALKKAGYRSKVHEKGYKNKPLTERQKKSNTRKSRIRAKVEHVFGSITNDQGGIFSRVIGFNRNAFKIGMMNLVYNFRRFSYLNKVSVSKK